MGARHDIERADVAHLQSPKDTFFRAPEQPGIFAFCRRICTRDELDAFNRSINLFDSVPTDGADLDIELSGVCGRLFCVWRMSSRTGFRAVPKAGSAPADVALVHMPTRGRLQYRDFAREHVAEAGFGLIMPLPEFRDLVISANYESINCMLRLKPMLRQMHALERADSPAAPDFETVADLGTPALRSLRHTILATLERLTEAGDGATVADPLVEEILLHQLIGSWPKKPPREMGARSASSRHVQRSLDFIEAHLALPMSVTEVAAAAGIGVRALQSSFRKDLGRTPVQHIIERRLEQVHDALRRDGTSSISTIASRWGFVHMSDFSRRYRQKFGCTPSQTQIRSARNG